MKFKSYSEVNEVVNELFKSLCSKYQENLETSMIKKKKATVNPKNEYKCFQ